MAEPVKNGFLYNSSLEYVAKKKQMACKFQMTNIANENFEQIQTNDFSLLF
jgi:hypothetical protein